MPQTPRTSVYHYIASIRNQAKQDYARRFWRYIQEGERGPEPDRGELSVMGAQAVRLRLWEFRDMMKNPARWAHGTMSYRHAPGTETIMRNAARLTRRKARQILHEGMVGGRPLTPSQIRFFGARAGGYPVKKKRRGRGNPYHRNPGGGIGMGTIALIGVGAFLFLGGGRALSSMIPGMGPAAVPPGYTPIGNGLYASPTGQVYARHPSTGQMIPAPAGAQPTSAEDLLTRAGIALIPTATKTLADWVSGLFTTQATATTPQTWGLPGGPAEAGGGAMPTGEAIFGAEVGLPPLAPLPSDVYEPWAGIAPGEGSIFTTELPPLDYTPTAYEAYAYDYAYEPTYDYGMVPDVGLTVGGTEATLYGDPWFGFMGLGQRRTVEPKYLRRPPSYR